MSYEGALQKATYEAGFVPIAMDAGANAGDWVSMENYRRLEIILFKAAGTAGDDPVITVSQATAAAGTGTKALDFTVIYEKVGTLASTTEWTRQTQTAANTYENTASAEAQAIIVIEIDAATKWTMPAVWLRPSRWPGLSLTRTDAEGFWVPRRKPPLCGIAR